MTTKCNMWFMIRYWIQKEVVKDTIGKIWQIWMRTVYWILLYKYTKIHLHTFLGIMIHLTYIQISSSLDNTISRAIYLGMKCYNACNSLSMDLKNAYIKHMYQIVQFLLYNFSTSQNIFAVFFFQLFYRSEIFQDKNEWVALAPIGFPIPFCIAFSFPQPV